MVIYDGIPPRHVAAAIANLGADRVRAAWRYLDQWAALDRSGVPRSTLRDAMRRPKDTAPLASLTEWWSSGALGLLVLCGSPGVGKTYAAARWTLLRHAEGKATTWISGASLSTLSERDRRLRLEEVADRAALVIDDVGAGATHGDWLKDQLQGLLQYRLDGLGPRGLTPTMLVSNGTREQLVEWAGPRVVDRAKLAGGFEQITARASLRSPLDKIDALGRGPEWYRAHRLVDVIGCEQVERYDDEGRERVDLDVGRRLDSAARRLGYQPCEEAEALLGLTRAAVEVEARRVVDAELALVRATATRFEVELDERLLSLEGVAAAMAGLIRKRQADEAQRVRDDAAAVVARARRYEQVADPIERRPAPAWTDGRDGRKALKRLGFSVAEVSGRWQTRRKLGDATQVLATGSATEADAWDIAARLCAEVDTRPGGDANP